MRGPIILLSPAKTLNFDSEMTAAIAAASPSQPQMPAKTGELVDALGKLSQAQIKSLMSLSDTLAKLNHERFSSFAEQPPRVAIGAFEGMAYKGLDAPTLSAPQLTYAQTHLRILCGLYGVLRPYDEIRPYRLEMSTRLAVGEHANLYKFWGGELTNAIAAEEPEWVLNVASQEYAKSISFDALKMPVITASFPGPAVYAKQARGEITRFMCERNVQRPEELKAFRGVGGAWSYVPDQSDELNLVFRRGAPAKDSGGGKGAKATPASTSGKRKAKAEEAEANESEDVLGDATESKGRRRR